MFDLTTSNLFDFTTNQVPIEARVMGNHSAHSACNDDPAKAVKSVVALQTIA